MKMWEKLKATLRPARTAERHQRRPKGNGSDTLKILKKTLLALPALFNVIPGLTVLQTGIGTPPGLKELFGGVIIAVGCLALLLLWANQARLKSCPVQKVNVTAVVLIVAFLVLVCIYLGLFSFCVIDYAEGAQAYFPLILFGDLSRLVDEAGSRMEALQPAHAGPARISQELEKPANIASRYATTVLLLLVYSGLFTCLTVAFGVVLFHRTKL
jgi:hypothetical protein